MCILWGFFIFMLSFRKATRCALAGFSDCFIVENVHSECVDIILLDDIMLSVIVNPPDSTLLDSYSSV